MVYFEKIKGKLLQSALFKDSVWSLIGNVLGKGLALIVGIVIARFLGKDIYGEYGMIKSTLMNIAIFSTFGLGYTATKFIAESKLNNKEKIREIVSLVITITLAVSSLLSLLLFIFSQEVAVYLNAPHLSLSLKIFAVTIVFNALTTVQIGILAGFNEFKIIAKNNVIVGVSTFLLTIPLTYFWNIEGALFALLLSYIINCILNNVAVRKSLNLYPTKSSTSQVSVKSLFSFSLPIALQEALYSITSWVYILLLVKFSDYGEVGIYSVAIQWSSVILFIPAVLRNVTLSHLSGTNKNQEQHNRVFRTMMFVTILSTLIPVFLVFLFSGFISKFYGASFDTLKIVLNISVFTTIFSCIVNVYSQEYISQNKNWIMFVVRLFRDVGTICLAYVLMTSILDLNYKATGAYWLVISSLVMNCITVLFLYLIGKIYLNFSITNA
ncbi:MAG: oligosaccharide flippase family protein [Dysgonomonas sp.]|nr:oligosaccharide flippase family protein [Dysgonomonas sp.]